MRARRVGPRRRSGLRGLLVLLALGLVALVAPDAVDAEDAPSVDSAAEAQPAATAPPIPGARQVDAKTVFFVKPGQPTPSGGLTNCGYVYYLDFKYLGPGTYYRIAFRDGVQTSPAPFPFTNLTTSLENASGYPLVAARGRRLSQIFGTGLGCGPRTDEIVAAAQADVANQTYQVWVIPSDRDTDGDGLLDRWETEGIDIDDNGSIDLDLAAMGADPEVRDLFVEVDWMEQTLGGDDLPWLTLSFNSMEPSTGSLARVVAAFANAPGDPIRLHIDAGPNSVMNPVTGAKWGALSRSNVVRYVPDLATEPTGVPNWALIKQLQPLEPARAEVFHATLFADQIGYYGDTIPRIWIKGATEGQPSDRVVIGRDDARPLTDFETGGTFMHELGHNLGLTHEGGPDGTCNECPEYRSIMNYRYANDPFGGVFDYSRGAPYDDWANLDFYGGAIGPPFEGEALVAADAPLAAGDGAVELVGPYTFLRGTGDALVYVDVHNPSATAATYTVKASGDLDLGDDTETVTVPAGEKRRVSFPVDTDTTPVGQATVRLELDSSLLGGVDELDAEVDVVDPAAVKQDLAKARTEVEGASATDVDPSVKASLLSQIDTAIGGTQTTTTTTAPTTSTSSTTTTSTAPSSTTSAVPAGDTDGSTQGDTLARTGTEPRPMVLVALATLAVGAALLATARRRRRALADRPPRST